MGFGNRRPILPAATDSLLGSADDTGLGTDVATDLSRQTDRSHHTIPDDGSPVTIATSLKKTLGKLTKTNQQSQTSLLIEYFEGNKDTNQRPSVRVKLRPSSSKKDKEKTSKPGVLTKSQSARKPIHTRNLSEESDLPTNIINESDISSLPPEIGYNRAKASRGIDIPAKFNGQESELSGSPEAKYIIPESDISSIPADSMLGTNQPAVVSLPAKANNANKFDVVEKSTLKPPVIPRERNLSNERITQKVIEKLSNKPRTSTSGKKHHSDTSRSRSSVSRDLEVQEPTGQPRKRLAKRPEDESMTTATGSSVVSGSMLSADPRSIDLHSNRSGGSNISITNPKLLQTVEDVVRRLILPELKEIKKDRRHTSHHSRYDKDTLPSDISESSLSREESSRRKSSGSKSRRRISKGTGEDPSSSSRRRHHRHRNAEYESPSEKSYRNSESFDSVSVEEDLKSHKRGKDRRVRDATAGVLAGAALTAAALKHHDSSSTLDDRERRKRRSKSRSSRSASVAESEEVFQKHNVPPMPMRSEIGSEITRSSLLSSNTDGTATPTRREVREVIRGSPQDILSPSSQSPPRNSINLKKGLGTHHGNFSEHDLVGHNEEDNEEYEEAEEHHHRYDAALGGAALGGALLAGHGLLTDPERARAYEQNLHHQHPIRRGLSPIQSVASYATTEPNRNSMLQPRSNDSLLSLKKANLPKDQISIASLSSAPSTDLARSRRAEEFSPDNRVAPATGGWNGPAYRGDRELDADDFFDEQHAENEQYRESYGTAHPEIHVQKSSPYNDDELRSPYLDKVTAGRQVAAGLGANPEYVLTPPAVESAVASLYEPSFVDGQSPYSSFAGSVDRGDVENIRSAPNAGWRGGRNGSPFKNHVEHFTEEDVLAPGHSRDLSLSPSPNRAIGNLQMPIKKTVHVETISVPAVPEGPDATSPQSEITTNPSPIQGPAGGLSRGNAEHWAYDPTSPRSRADDGIAGAERDLGAGGADLIPQALAINRVDSLDSRGENYYKGQPLLTPTPPGIKDEGYETGANARSPDLYSNGPANTQNSNQVPDVQFQDSAAADDPFTSTQHDEYLNELSRGFSPTYDATQALDNIQSKDIVALMDHLTVRDAQRNARDTEILITLVRSAAEMRNSFEDMKRFIAQQDEVLMDTTEKQHENTQRAIGGPRPQPAVNGQFARSAASEDGEVSTKRRNVFKRALRGLSSKNSQEIHNIEAMLMQLLGDVESLRAVQGPGPVRNEPRLTSFTSADHPRLATDPGYEPEGQAGTSSTGDRSGFFSNNSSRQADYRGAGGRRSSGNRVSTVMEGDEDFDDYDPGVEGEEMIQDDPQRTPRALTPQSDMPTTKATAATNFNTPPRVQKYNGGNMSNENTPHLSTEGNSGRKHRSFASSFLPKMVSRWSKTTASSGGDAVRSSTQTKPRPYSQVSRSGSNLGEYEYDAQGDDRLRSNLSLQDEEYRNQENRPPSPLIPSQVSEKPKYQAHRNSVNLQHPQPRQGPSGRHQFHLETEANNFYHEQMSPTSQTSSQWEQQNNLPSMVPSSRTHNQANNLHQIPDDVYSDTSSAMMDRNREQEMQSPMSAGSGSQRGPPRPPKILDDDPLVPPRPPKVMMSPTGNRGPTYVDHVAAARAGSPAFDKSPVSALRASSGQTRKPSGPRPLASQSQQNKLPAGDLNAVKRTRFRGSPNQIDSEEDVVY